MAILGISFSSTVFLALALCGVLGQKVEPPSVFPLLDVNPPVSASFDVSAGIGRSAEDCKLRLTRAADSLARDYQTELLGGMTARVGSPCNPDAWQRLRKDFVTDEMSGRRKNVVRSLEQQVAAIKAGTHSLHDLCIACADEPLLECKEGTPPTCACWRDYHTQEQKLFEDDRRNYTVCVIREWGTCRPKSNVRCAAHLFCDNENSRCVCKSTQPGCKTKPRGKVGVVGGNGKMAAQGLVIGSALALYYFLL